MSGEVRRGEKEHRVSCFDAQVTAVDKWGPCHGGAGRLSGSIAELSYSSKGGDAAHHWLSCSQGRCSQDSGCLCPACAWVLLRPAKAAAEESQALAQVKAWEEGNGER